MKKILISITILFFTLIGFSQKQEDSVKAQVKAIEKIITETPVKELQDFLYKNISAERYNEFMQYYNEFIRRKYLDSLQKK